MIEPSVLEQLVKDGWVSAQRHPTLPLTIYNYTPKTPFSKHWTPETILCRGLVLADDGEIVARSFPKFFNLGEHQGPMPDEPHHVYEKMDGSLFIVAWYRDEIVTATRGSFTSPQATVGRELYLNNGSGTITYPNEGITFLFEVIYPENRIVVDYGDARELVYLATIENQTGRTIQNQVDPFRRADQFTVDFRNPPVMPNAEGYVVHFIGESDLRIKIKFDEYVRLHRLLTGVNARTIWEYRASGRDIDELISSVPDEFYQWVRDTDAGLRNQVESILAECTEAMRDCPRHDRKTAAEYIKTKPHSAVMFSMLDDKDPRPIIWKLVKPAADRPFRQDVA